MSLVQLYIPTEVAHDTVAELGELGNVQFKDVCVYHVVPWTPVHEPFCQLNPTVNPFQRSFVGEIRRFEDMARRVRFFTSQIEKERDMVPIRPLYDSAPLITVGPSAAHNLDELDITLAEHETRLLQMNESYKLLSERTKELLEARHVLRETAGFFEKASLLDGSLALYSPAITIKAETHQTDIRTSFDESSAPLLQHDDRENQYSSTVQFDLEYVHLLCVFFCVY